jgi:hypothetical protein
LSVEKSQNNASGEFSRENEVKSGLEEVTEIFKLKKGKVYKYEVPVADYSDSKSAADAESSAASKKKKWVEKGTAELLLSQGQNSAGKAVYRLTGHVGATGKLILNAHIVKNMTCKVQSQKVLMLHTVDGQEMSMIKLKLGTAQETSDLHAKVAQVLATLKE